MIDNGKDTPDKRRSVLAFATKGTGTNEELRLKELVSKFDVELLAFNKSKKFGSLIQLTKQIAKHRNKLIVMEGTGIAGGLACLIGRFLFGHRYVVSSGDAVGPFIASNSILAGPIFALYERILCRFASGFIGWTPYLVGRALTFGVPRAVTAPGWVIGKDTPENRKSRQDVRTEWNVSEGTIVFGIAGAIVWNYRRKYCYGLELVRAIKKTRRTDVAVVIVGEGSGIEYLKREAGDLLGKKVFLPGSVPVDQVMNQLRGMDIGSLPQSTDAVGSFRYTTKISEYRSARLPIVTNRIPASYDLDDGQIWRLPGKNPWDPKFIKGLAVFMENLDAEVLGKTSEIYDTSVEKTFVKDRQLTNVNHFLKDLMEELKIN